jgi:hypothetical protein
MFTNNNPNTAVAPKFTKINAMIKMALRFHKNVKVYRLEINIRG